MHKHCTGLMNDGRLSDVGAQCDWPMHAGIVEWKNACEGWVLLGDPRETCIVFDRLYVCPPGRGLMHARVPCRNQPDHECPPRARLDCTTLQCRVQLYASPMGRHGVTCIGVG